MPNRIRAIDPTSAAEVELVASRMRETLMEVLGRERAGEMYTHEWLVQRVRWHLDPAVTTGQVFLAEAGPGAITGHTIVRIEDDGEGRAIGLFSTIFVAPEARQQGVAIALIARGEAWMIEHGMTTAVTYTDEGNAKLHALFIGQGYAMSGMPDHFVKLSKPLAPG